MSDGARTRGLTAIAQMGGRARVVLLVAVGVVVLLVAGGIWSVAWGNGLRDDQRLFPGTEIAGVSVGGSSVEEARDVVAGVVAARLDTPLTVTDDGRTWTATPRQLGATSDLAEVVDAAWARTRDAGVLDLARRRLGFGGAAELQVSLDASRDEVTSWVDEMAAAVDVAPSSATLAWVEGTAEVTDGVVGRAVQRDEAVQSILEAIGSGVTTVTLPVEDAAPALTTERATAIADDVTTRVDAALDRAVSIRLTDPSAAPLATRTVTGRELGATTNAADVLAAHGEGDVELQVTEDAAHEVVDEVVMPHEVAAVDAQLQWSRGAGFSSAPGETGLAIDHQAATAALVDTVVDGRDRLDLSLEVAQPDVTQADFDEVLLVRQADRKVDLVRDGTVVRTWDVAIGTSGYPTPTGQFVIGLKRFEPTWHNPDPDDWGRDMPASIGPGPGNPLGLRALNWYDDGVDTLIRFHGTANEASIGRAASHGCVRMTNPDVIELYDLVETGTVVLSVH